MEEFKTTRTKHNLDRRMKLYVAPKVLIAGGFGIWPGDRESAIRIPGPFQK